MNDPVAESIYQTVGYCDRAHITLKSVALRSKRFKQLLDELGDKCIYSGEDIVMDTMIGKVTVSLEKSEFPGLDAFLDRET